MLSRRRAGTAFAEAGRTAVHGCRTSVPRQRLRGPRGAPPPVPWMAAGRRMRPAPGSGTDAGQFARGQAQKIREGLTRTTGAELRSLLGAATDDELQGLCASFFMRSIERSEDGAEEEQTQGRLTQRQAGATRAQSQGADVGETLCKLTDNTARITGIDRWRGVAWTWS